MLRVAKLGAENSGRAEASTAEFHLPGSMEHRTASHAAFNKGREKCHLSGTGASGFLTVLAEILFYPVSQDQGS